MDSKDLKALKKSDLLRIMKDQANEIERLRISDIEEEYLPNSSEVKKELDRLEYNERYQYALVRMIVLLILVAAISVLIATFFLPVFQIHGVSMVPRLAEKDVVIALKESKVKRGDIIGFYYNNKVLVKRVIALEGEWVNIDAEGNVYINDTLLKEPYLGDKAMGECDINLPYQVPEGRYFACGDHRFASIDSRSSSLGCVAGEQIVGKIGFRIWPITRLGFVN